MFLWIRPFLSLKALDVTFQMPSTFSKIDHNPLTFDLLTIDTKKLYKWPKEKKAFSRNFQSFLKLFQAEKAFWKPLRKLFRSWYTFLNKKKLFQLENFSKISKVQSFFEIKKESFGKCACSLTLSVLEIRMRWIRNRFWRGKEELKNRLIWFFHFLCDFSFLTVWKFC